MDEPGEVERCVDRGCERVLLRFTPAVDAGHDEKSAPAIAAEFGSCPRRRWDRRARAGSRAGDARSPRPPRLPGPRHGRDPLGRRAARRAVCERPCASSVGRRRSSTSAAASAFATSWTSPSRRAPEEYARTVSEQFSDTWSAEGLPKPQLVFEPGRSLVGRAGLRLYRVGVVKRSSSRTWVAVDGGMSSDPRPALYGARYSALPANGPTSRPTGAVCSLRQALRERRRPDRGRRSCRSPRRGGSARRRWQRAPTHWRWRPPTTRCSARAQCSSERAGRP